MENKEKEGRDMNTLYFIIREGKEYYVEPHRTPIVAADIEVDGKSIVDYKFTEHEAKEIVNILESTAV